MDLNKINTRAPKHLDKEETKQKTTEMVLKMRWYQQMMFAQKKYSILIVFQWMDAAGKDNAIKKVFSGLNPLGCDAVAFGKPTAEEYAHDFLRRVHQHAPAKWMVQIFNRSYYEDILVPTVEWLFPAKKIKERYDDINNFEKLLIENNTIILKFFLHISPEKQTEKLQERLELRRKFWKFDPSDLDAREKRDDYQKVYHKIFDICNLAPRNIIPADQKRYKNYLITKTIIDAFENEMKLKRPDMEEEHKKNEDEYKKILKKSV